MALEFILSIAPTVFEYTIGPVIRHAGYAFCHARKVAELKNQVEKLATARGSLQNSAQEDRRRGYEIQPDVEKWLTDAQNAIEEAGELTQSEEEEAKKKCFAGWCPNINTRYQLGKKAAKKALAIEGLKNEGTFDRNQISYRPAPQQIVSSSVHGFEGLPSRASIFQAVMDVLSDPNVKMIGVYGLGGTGKTTLAKEVRQQADGKLFNVVAMATLSAKPDLQELKEVQGNIADVLGLKFEAESLDGRANQLRQRLMKEDKVLIILDNLSEKIDLENLGIPLTNEKWVGGRGADSVREGFQFNSQLESIQQEEKGCKVLMTSRNGRLLTDEMEVQKDFKLDLMTEEESWTLFDRKVGGLKTPSLQSVAIEVAKKCGGLPILLVTMASALKNKEFELWNDALQRLSTFEDEEIQEKVIEFSYDHLPGEEAKSFFLLCGLFTDTNIFILDLMKYSMGLGILKHIEYVRDARNRVQKLIGDLKALCLLSESEHDGLVKIHDIVQGVAASIASRTQFGFKKVGASLEEFQRMGITRCTKLFLEECDVSMLSLKSQCPAVELFRLTPKDLSLKIPDSFFEGITKLQVLDFTVMRFSSLPLSLGFLTSLHTLCLDFCKLEDISVITQLKNLEILSLMGSEIVELPRDLAQLSRLKLLDLSNCSKLEFIPENVLSQLSRLEELLMSNSFVNWEAKHSDNQSNASLSELEHLSLTNLEIHVPDAKKLPKRLSSKTLERYKIFIGDKWNWGGKYQTSRTLKLKLDTSIHSKHGLKTLLKDVEDLYLDEVRGITNVLYDLHSEGFPQLKHLHVRNGGEIRHIIDSKRPVPAFPALESLILHNLMNLEKISWRKLLDGDFCTLRIVKVRSCNKLKNLFSFSIVRRNLQQLGEMEIIDCSDMEVIFADENEEEEEEDHDKNEVVEFTQLYSLKLQLPLLRSFCPKGKVSPASTTTSRSRQKHPAMDPPFMEIESANDAPMPLFNEMIVFPNLKELKLSSIGVDKIWPDHFADQSSFYKLTSLTVETCQNLNYLFTSSTVKRLAQLQKLEICDCKLMEHVVITTKGEIIGKAPFPNLKFLKVKGLPKLSTFCIGDLIEFPYLEELWIEDCLELKAFISTPVTPNREFNLCLFDEKIALPMLNTLQVLNLDRLNMIWHNELHKASFCKLKNLKVMHCRELSQIFPSVMLTRFQDLEQLDVQDCDSLEEVFDLQVLMDIKETRSERVNQLRTLYLRNLPNLKHIWKENPQRKISFQSLRSVFVGDCPLLKSIFPAPVAECLLQLELLDIMSCGVEEIVAMREGGGKEAPITRFMFPKLKILALWELSNLDKFYPRVHTTEWPALKALYVYNCDKMKIFSFESQSLQGTCEEEQPDIQVMQPLFSFQEVAPGLEALRLNNEDVTMIWKCQFPANLFDKLKFLALQCFHDESTAFPFEFLHRFHNVKELGVGFSQFKELFASKELFDNEEHKRALAQIRFLKLRNMPVLEQIWNQESQPDHVLPNLEILVVWSCDNLSNLAPSSASFQSLTTLEMKDCHGLINIVASSTAKSLVQLQTMRIIQCNALTEILAREGCETEEDVMFRRLVTLELNCLPSLTSFCSANHNFKFPSLTEIIVSQCPKMQFFSKGALSTPKLENVKQKYEDQKGRWHRNLNATIQQLFTERNEHN